MRFPFQFDTGRWLVPLLLLLGVLAPTACLLWFLNVAVNNQRDASRRKLAEAYRGQLILLRGRADAFWEKRAADLDLEARGESPPVVFQRVVERGLADAVVCLNPDGSHGYPALAMTVTVDKTSERGDWLAARSLESQREFSAAAMAYAEIAKAEPDVSIAARAAQARIRCLMRSGGQTAALRAIEQDFGRGRLMRGVDLEGRLIAAEEQLLAVRLKDGSAAGRLHALLADYAGPPIPSAQRLFLMQELGADQFPTYSAERLAARFLEQGRVPARQAMLEPSEIPGVWTLRPGERMIALYRTETAVAAMRGLSSGLGTGLSAALDVTPPGASPPRSDDWIPAGSRLPGWQLSVSLAGDRPFNEMARRQMVSLVWIGFLAIVAIAITALIAGQAFRRHWQQARLKTDLVAAVSHELKTPLSSMRALVDSLLDDDRPDSQKTRDYLALIAQENLRLSRLIENFLTFSRLERRRQKFELHAIQPDSVVQSALEAARERWQSPDFRLEVSVAPGLPPVRADHEALVSVLLNLLDNAYKYTPGEKQIALRAFQRDSSVVFAVEDNGIGIAPREQKRIFRRFYQVDRRLARETGGCGLGLSIVEFIVREHGGALRVESQPGRGSTFSVALPCASAIKGAA